MQKQNPEAVCLRLINWQLFSTLTFESIVSEPIRIKMAFAWLRVLASNFRIHFHTLLWCLRQERGEIGGRLHFHSLIANLPVNRLVNPGVAANGNTLMRKAYVSVFYSSNERTYGLPAQSQGTPNKCHQKPNAIRNERPIV